MSVNWEARAQSAEARALSLEGQVEGLKRALEEGQAAVRELLEMWPADSVPPGPLCVRIADFVNGAALASLPQGDQGASLAESAAVGSLPALPQTPLSNEFTATHRHVKRGSDYQFVGPAILQTSADVTDYTAMAVYRGSGGDLWVRPATEWLDGRFKALPQTPVSGDER